MHLSKWAALLLVLASPAAAKLTPENEEFSPTRGFRTESLEQKDVLFGLAVRQNKAGGPLTFFVETVFNYRGHLREYRAIFDIEGRPYQFSPVNQRRWNCGRYTGCDYIESVIVTLTAAEFKNLKKRGQFQLQAVSRSGSKTVLTIPSALSTEIWDAGKQLCAQCVAD